MTDPAWRVELTRTAIRDLKRLDPPVRQRVQQALEAFARDPHASAQLRKLTAAPEWRLRVGDWRVLLLLNVANRATSLGAPSEADVFVTPAGAMDGLSSSQIADRLTLQNADGSLRSGPFSVFEFDTPEGVASPVFRDDPGFVPGGSTAGGAPEYLVPNLNFDDLGNLTRTDAP